MNKKITISIVGLMVVVILFFTVSIITKNEEKNLNEANNTQNIVQISKEGVTDECTEEWSKYNLELQYAFEQASNDITEDSIHYLLKSKDGYIYVYYLDENKEEYLYKKTTIAVDYLSQEDISDLEVGIEVVGNDSMNRILEDYE